MVPVTYILCAPALSHIHSAVIIVASELVIRRRRREPSVRRRLSSSRPAHVELLLLRTGPLVRIRSPFAADSVLRRSTAATAVRPSVTWDFARHVRCPSRRHADAVRASRRDHAMYDRARRRKVDKRCCARRRVRRCATAVDTNVGASAAHSRFKSRPSPRSGLLLRSCSFWTPLVYTNAQSHVAVNCRVEATTAR